MAELKPCPFCGGEPDLIDRGDFYWVYCESCDALGGKHRVANVAIDSWNWRTDTAAHIEQENRRLREALKLIATEDQDDRPTPTENWDTEFDWRRRSMRQEQIARQALKKQDDGNN